MKKSFLIFILMLSTNIYACGDDPDFHFDQIKEIGVTASIFGTLDISLDELQTPFKNLLTKQGVKVDLNLGDNIVHTRVDVNRVDDQKSPIYIVNISFQYTEPCSTKRQNIEVLCPIWERSEDVKTFDNPKAVKEYVLQKTSEAAQEFTSQFKRQ